MEQTQEYFPPERAAQPPRLYHGIQQALTKLDSQSRFLRLRDVAERLKHRRIALDVDDAARQWLANHGYSDVYCARAIARAVRSDVLFRWRRS